jgi:hypothetical protein
MDKIPFQVICNHCLRKSKGVAFESVDGRDKTEVVKELGFDFLVMPNGSGFVVCNNWCKWRHGKNTGIHKVLNKLFRKASAFKQ